jgi:hypothetical protein
MSCHGTAVAEGEGDNVAKTSLPKLEEGVDEIDGVLERNV